MKSKYTGLWLLLALGLTLFTVISFADDLEFFGIRVKKAPIAEKLIGEYLSTEEIKLQKEALEQELAEKAKPQENPVDSAPQVFLIFGDSMTQNLSLRLAAYARQNGHKIHAVNWDSSGTRIWAQCDTLDQLIRRFNPTFIFVSLGSNELYIKHLDNYRGYVRSILSKIDTIPYIWIGPPNWKPDEGINDMIQEETAPGSFFLSAGIELPRKSDQIHPTREGAATWVDSIVRWIPKSAHPIVMDFPSDSIASSTRLRHTNIYYLKAVH